jgi:hypothetical protein
MSNDHGDPHAEDPDLDQEDYEDLDEIAEESRESRPQSAATAEAVAAASEAVAELDTRDLVARADNVCLGSVNAPGEAFSDPTPDDTCSSLLQTAGGLTAKLGFLGRRQARADFLAFHLGFVAANHHGPTADSVLTLVSKALAGAARPADSVGQLASAWSAGEKSFFDRMAQRYAEESPQGPDLAEHIVFMSIAADLRANDPEKFWLWNDRVQMLELAEELMAGMQPGDSIDIGELYRRADALVQAGSYFPPQVAEVTRLALAALAGDRVPVRNAPDTKTAVALDNMAQKLDRGSIRLQGDMQGLTVVDPAPRIPVLRKAEFELGETWTYFESGFDLRLAQAPDGQQRAKALHAALGDSIGPLLAELSAARRSGTPNDVADNAASVGDALTEAETRLRQILGKLDDLQRMKALDVEASALRLVGEMRERVAALCRDAALGRDRGSGPFDAAIMVARMQTTRGIVSEATRAEKPGVISDAIGNAVERLPIKLRTASWSVGVADRFTKWSDAAQARRLGAELRADPKDPDNPDKKIVWPGLSAATQAVATAVAGAREAAKSLGSADRSRFNGNLDEGLLRISAWLRSKAAAKDGALMSLDPANLAAIIDAQVTPVEVVSDPAQAWKDGKADLVKRLPRGTDLDVKLDFRKALGDWKSAVEATPRNDANVVTSTWAVLAKLSDYRAAVKAAVTDPDLASEFGALFDKIGESLAARLAALH